MMISQGSTCEGEIIAHKAWSCAGTPEGQMPRWWNLAHERIYPLTPNTTTGERHTKSHSSKSILAIADLLFKVWRNQSSADDFQTLYSGNWPVDCNLSCAFLWWGTSSAVSISHHLSFLSCTKFTLSKKDTEGPSLKTIDQCHARCQHFAWVW